MSVAEEIIEIKPGSASLAELRSAALQGDSSALKKYVYFCVLQGLRADKKLKPRARLQSFRRLLAIDPIEVRLG